LKWCDTLYKPDAHYKVYGQRWTLQEYKDAMEKLFSVFDMELGDFYNMLDLTTIVAILYD
jgi:hypothetical protein